MKTTMIAALAAAQLSAAAWPAQAAEQPPKEAAADPTRVEEGADVEGEDPRAAPRAAAQDEPRKKKRKSIGDKLLTGAAVVLGVGALAVGGLLVAIFVG